MHPFLHLGIATVSTYYLVISAGVTVSIFWFLARAERLELPRLVAIDLCLVTLVSGFIGARLLHVFFEEPAYYVEAPIRVLEFWYGGFVYLGGLVASLIAVWYFCSVKREAFFLWADLAAPPASLAYAIGRIGCFLNGCCYGRHCDLPWAIDMNGDFRHPTQLYASFFEFGALGILLLVQSRLKSSGTLFGIWLILHALGRMVMEGFRGDPRGNPVLGLSLGTVMSLGLLIAGTAILLTRPRRNKNSL